MFIVVHAFIFANENIAVEDPYRWLETNDNPKALEWLAKEECRSEVYFQDNEIRKWVSAHLATRLDFDSMDVPQKIGENYFFIGKLQGRQQSALYKMEGKGVISPMIESEDSDSLIGYVVDKTGSFLAYGLSSSGSDWQSWRIRNLDNGKDLEDVLNGIKFSSPVWDREGNGLFYFKFDEGGLEGDLTIHQQLYYHRIGTVSTQDRKVFSAFDSRVLFSDIYLSENGQFLLFSTKNGSHSNGIMWANLKNVGDCEFFELFPVGNIRYDYIGSVENRLFFTTNENATNGKIISIDPLIPESKRDHILESDAIIEQACISGNKIVVSYQKDACSQIKIFDSQGHFHKRIDLPAICTTSLTWKNLNLSGASDSNEFFFPFTDFIHPITVYKANVETGNYEIFLSPQTAWQSEDYQSKQIFYPGKDGTLIPMFVVCKKDVKLNGENPLLLYGYGGFNISLTPFFDAKMLAWMDLGGIYAIANIRGGGEYGEEWHRAGMLKNKQVVFDDFIAAAEWLIVHGYTNSSKMAINGRSNGGLLAGACIVQRPDLFKAAVIDVGVLDMLRFHLFTMGWLWTEEYGSPNRPEDRENLNAYSPYHQIKEGIAYPSTLITTADHDDRVVPWHSYKFTAALHAAQAGRNPVLLKVYKNTGHGSGKSFDQLLQEGSDYLYFLIKELEVNSGNFLSHFR